MWDRATHLEVPGVPAVQYSWPESVHGRAHLPHCPRKASVSERFTGPSGDDHLMNSCPKSQLFSSKEKKTTPFLFSDDLFAVANPLLRVCVCVCSLNRDASAKPGTSVVLHTDRSPAGPESVWWTVQGSVQEDILPRSEPHSEAT